MPILTYLSKYLKRTEKRVERVSSGALLLYCKASRVIFHVRSNCVHTQPAQTLEQRCMDVETTFKR